MSEPTKDSGGASPNSHDWDYHVYLSTDYSDSGNIDTPDISTPGGIGGYTERRLEERKVVEQLFHCVVDKAAKLNRTVADEAREDVDELLSLHRKLCSRSTLEDEEKEWIRDTFQKWKAK